MSQWWESLEESWAESGDPDLEEHATMTEKPSWLRHGTKASFEFRPLQMSSFGDGIVRSGIVNEVSVLSPGVEPNEPLATVRFCKPSEPPKAKPAARETVIYGGGAYATATPVRRAPAQPVARPDEIEELHRRLDWLGPDAKFEDVLQNLQAELGYLQGLDSVYRDTRRR